MSREDRLKGAEQSHPNYPSVDQSDRTLPRNLRQTGDADVKMVVSNRIRQSPYWHLALEEGCWLASSYNRTFNPRGYTEPEDGGIMAEYDPLVERVTLWEVAAQRIIRVAGSDAESFLDYVITRDATDIEPMNGRYTIVCNHEGCILNDPVLLRLAEDEFWFSLSDSDLLFWLQGVNADRTYDVSIDEIDAPPLQIQGPLSVDVMTDVVDESVRDMPYYGLQNAEINGCSVLVSQTGWSGEKGYEVYVRDGMENAEAVWNPLMDAVEEYGGQAIGPAQHRRIAAGILSWGQDMDHETSPFQVNLGYHVPDDTEADYIGKEELERQKERIENGEYPFAHKMIGLKMGGEPIREYASDFWLVSDPETGEECGYVTSPWWNPELETNIGLALVPAEKLDMPLDDRAYEEERHDIRFRVHLPDQYAERPGEPVDAHVAEVPFKESVNPSAREKAKMNGRRE